jgi:hypothetical protein
MLFNALSAFLASALIHATLIELRYAHNVPLRPSIFAAVVGTSKKELLADAKAGTA